MSKLEEQGFLSDEAEASKKEIYKKYADLFDFAKDINKYCVKLLSELKIDWNNNHKLIIHALFLRIVESYQAAFLLLERGMMPQAKVIMRAMLEILFTLVALQKKPDLLNSYLDQHEKTRLRALKSALNFQGKELKEAAKLYGVEEQYIKLKDELKEKTLNTLLPWQWASEAKLTDFYNLYYVSYSNSIHSNPSALDDHVDKSPEELNMAAGPSDKDLFDVLKCGIYIVLNAAKSTELVNGNNIDETIEFLMKKFEPIDELYISNAS